MPEDPRAAAFLRHAGPVVVIWRGPCGMLPEDARCTRLSGMSAARLVWPLSSPRMSTVHSSPLPMRDGVSPSCVALPPGAWPSIAAFLCERFPAIAAEEWAARMAAGDVVDESGRPVTAARPFQAGLRVFYYRALARKRRFLSRNACCFRTSCWWWADKPHFLPVTPGGRYLQETLLVRLKRKLGIATLSPIHRIDRETAGLVVFAVQPATRGRYHALFAERVVEKAYEAVRPFRADLALPCVYRSRLVDATNFMQMPHGSGRAERRNAHRIAGAGRRSGALPAQPAHGAAPPAAHALRRASACRSCMTAFTRNCCRKTPMITPARCNCWRAASPSVIR